MAKESYGHSTHNYFAFGLGFESMLELPELPLASPSQASDIRIRIGQVPELLPEAGEQAMSFQVTPQDVRVDKPEVARYQIKNGSEIIIDPAHGSSLKQVRLLLYAPVFGALFHQRGLLPIHASAVEIGTGCVAFAGHSGAGKSSLATYLHDQGYPVVADDICLLSIPGSQGIQAFPGVPAVKLWKEALDMFGKDARNYERVIDTADKFKVPPRQLSAKKALPLVGIVQFGKAAPSQCPVFCRLRGLDAVEMILEETYWQYFIHKMNFTEKHFRMAANIANQVPLYRCSMDKDWQRMRAVEAFIQRLIDPSGVPI